MRLGLLALIFIFCADALAQAKVIQYLDDEGNVFEVPHLQAVPAQYRDRAIEVDKPREPRKAPPIPEAKVKDRLQDMLNIREDDLPPSPWVVEDIGESAPSGDAANTNAANSGRATSGRNAANELGSPEFGDKGQSGQSLASAAANVDLNKLKESLAKQKDPLLRRLILASTAALATGYLWVVLLAILLFVFTVTTRRLIALEDSPVRRRFWRWGFPLLAVVFVVLLHKWRYPKYLEVLEELLRAFGA